MCRYGLRLYSRSINGLSFDEEKESPADTSCAKEKMNERKEETLRPDSWFSFSITSFSWWYYLHYHCDGEFS